MCRRHLPNYNFGNRNSFLSPDFPKSQKHFRLQHTLLIDYFANGNFSAPDNFVFQKMAFKMENITSKTRCSKARYKNMKGKSRSSGLHLLHKSVAMSYHESKTCWDSKWSGKIRKDARKQPTRVRRYHLIVDISQGRTANSMEECA